MAYEIGETLIGLGGGYLHTSFRGSPANLDLVRLTGYQYAGEKQTIMGYYNSGFLSGLGRALKSAGPYIAAAGSIAAEVLPAIYHTGSNQTAAAGPTSHPVAEQAAKSTALSGGGMGGAIARAEQAALHPITTTEQLLGMGGGGRGRYGQPGQKGYHMIRKGPHAGLWVRNRHRNVCNIHALRRSLSRLHGFEKVARKVVHFVHPKRAVGHAVFKRRRRRA